jgi:hypothetical protein
MARSTNANVHDILTILKVVIYYETHPDWIIDQLKKKSTVSTNPEFWLHCHSWLFYDQNSFTFYT